MRNLLFSLRQLHVLQRTERWRLISSGLPSEVAPARRTAHDAWARQHADSHPHREVLIVLAGSGLMGFNGRSYPTRPGTVLLIDAMEPHDLRYPVGHPAAEHLWFFFMEGHCGVSLFRLGARFKTGGARVWMRSYSFTDLGLSSPRSLFPDEGAAAPVGAVRQRCIAALTLLAASLIEKGYQPQAASRVESVQAEVIAAVVRHIQESDGRACRLDDLARIAGYSKYHFLRLFQERTGMSLRHCIDDARTQAFQRMTAATLPLKAIAEQMGFAYPSALCRWRRRLGL